MLQYCAMPMMLVLVAQNKDDLQRLLYRFICTANQVSEYGFLCLKNNKMPDNFKNTYKMQTGNRKQNNTKKNKSKYWKNAAGQRTEGQYKANMQGG